jgi:putative transposase
LRGSGAGAGGKRDRLEVSGRLKSALPSKGHPSTKKGFSKERVEAVLKSGGKLSRADLLRCRVRWFSDGVAIGGKGFVEGIFTKCRQHFGANRKDGARKLREDAAGSLHALRNLQVEAVS